MKIIVVAPVGVGIPVTNYGGIEAEAQWFSSELSRRGHEVTLMGNLADGPSPDGWVGKRIHTESDSIVQDRYELLRNADVVHDFTHSKLPRLAHTKKYWATVMWTDVRGPNGANIYPSVAVREAFNDPTAPVIPLGIPLEGIEVSPPTPGKYVCLGRIASYKGQVEAIRIARKTGVKLTVAGHTGPYADAYYTLVVRHLCEEAGFDFIADPPDLNSLLDDAVGLLHVHNWIESFSLVAAQALLRGVPILTTDVGAPQEWIRSTDGGMVVPSKDIQAGRWETAGVSDFFETNWSSRRAGISKRARELFDIRKVADRYEELWGGKHGDSA